MLTSPIAISSCVANSLASPSAACATNVMGNVQSATVTYDQQLSCGSATNARLGTIKINVWSVVERALATPSIALNALG